MNQLNENGIEKIKTDNPAFYELFFSPKVLESSKPEIEKNLDHNEEDNEEKEVVFADEEATEEEGDDLEEVVFPFMSSDELWDAAMLWDSASELSDFEFDIDLCDFGVCTKISSLAVAETRLETSAGPADFCTATDSDMVVFKAGELLMYLESGVLNMAEADLMVDTSLPVDTIYEWKLGLERKRHETETIPLAAQLVHEEAGMMEAMAGWLAVLEADKREALQQLEQTHAHAFIALESRLHAEQQQLLATAEVAKVEVERALKVLQSETQDWKEMMLGRLKSLEDGIEVGRMRKLDAELEAALCRVECLEDQLHEARQEPDQSPEDELPQVYMARQESDQSSEHVKQLVDEDTGWLRHLQARMEGLRKADEVLSMVDKDLEKLCAFEALCGTAPEKEEFAAELDRLNILRQDVLAVTGRCQSMIVDAMVDVHAHIGLAVVPRDDATVGIVMDQEPDGDGEVQTTGSVETSRKRRNRRRQRNGNS